VYNEQERVYLHKLRLKDPTLGIKNKIFLKKLKYIKKQGATITRQLKRETRLLDRNINIDILKKYKHHNLRLYCDFIERSCMVESFNMFFLRRLYLNKRKFEKTYLLPLNKLLNNVYDKKVEFNIINLKYFFLNSDIFSEAIAIKIKKKKRVLKVLKSSLKVVKLPFLNRLSSNYNLNKLSLTSFTSKLKYFNSSTSYNDPKSNLDVLTQFLQTLKKNNDNIDKSPNYIETAILSSIKLKSVNGVRIEASGRLSRRFTASRSVFKIKYKGSLKNIDSSYNNLPSVLLRGHARSNIQYTNITSSTRNGSFGLKG